MDTAPPELDDVTRFARLRAESLRLLDDARSLVGEMRSALDHCKRHRPPIETLTDVAGGPAFPPAMKTHRGARVRKKPARRIPRRPR